MSNETIYSYSSQVNVITGSASIAPAGFNGSAECNSVGSASLGNYPLADLTLFASFSSSVSSASQTVVVYRRDLNIDSTNDAPIPQSAAPAYSNIAVGAFVIPPYTAASAGYFTCPDVPLAKESEFYIENRTNANIVSTYTLKLTPKTFAPAP